MDRDRPTKSWRDRDRTRDHSLHRREPHTFDRAREEAASVAASREARSALEALFSPKKPEVEAPPAPAKTPARIVLPAVPNADPRNEERRKLLGKLLGATGPGPISKATEEFFAAGFELPEDQEIYLQLLEHSDEGRVRDAIDTLSRIFAGQLPKRKPVLDQRLRRIEEHAEDKSTREAAACLRKFIHGRGLSQQSAR